MNRASLLRLLGILKEQGPDWHAVRGKLAQEAASDFTDAPALIEKWAKEGQGEHHLGEEGIPPNCLPAPAITGSVHGQRVAAALLPNPPAGDPGGSGGQVMSRNSGPGTLA
jgi:hypothetical protein